MDDYLAKPVKGPVLESMILKWADEGKKERRRQLAVFKQNHEDVESICTAPSSTNDSDPAAEADSGNDDDVTPLAKLFRPTPVMNFQDRRSFLSPDIAEKVSAARYEKLLAVTGLKEPRHVNIPRYDTGTRTDGPRTPLTFENMGLLNRELEINPFDSWPNTSQNFCEGPSGADSMLNSPDIGSIPATPSPIMTTKERPESMRLEIGRRLAEKGSSTASNRRRSEGTYL